MKKIFTVAIFLFSSLTALDLYKFLDQIKKPIPAWMEEQIERDLKPFQDLSKETLDLLYATEPSILFRVRVQDGRLSVEVPEHAKNDPRVQTLSDPFHGLHHIKPFPNVDLLIGGEEGNHAYPIFTTSKNRTDRGKILMPDGDAIFQYEPKKSELLTACKFYSWDMKNDLLFYRGEKRKDFLFLSARYDQLIDAESESLQMQHLASHKYVIGFDLSSLPYILHSNSLCFGIPRSKTQWFYNTLIPYVHYIPIREDGTDLFTQLLWAKDHPKECQDIILRMQQISQSVICNDSVFEYVYRLVRKYAEKQKL